MIDESAEFWIHMSYRGKGIRQVSEETCQDSLQGSCDRENK